MGSPNRLLALIQALVLVVGLGLADREPWVTLEDQTTLAPGWRERDTWRMDAFSP